MTATTQQPTPGQTLRELLEQKGWSQKELARRTGLSQPYISDMCRGARPISAETAVILERVLGTLTAEMWMQLETQRRLREAREGAS